MSLRIPTETVTVRGMILANRLSSRLWVDDTEFMPDAIRSEFNTYCTEFTWGYSGTGPGFTALAVSYGIFKEKHIARFLSSLIEEQYVLDWPFRQSFNQEINLIDFWTRNQGAIEEAEEKAGQSREWEAEDIRAQAIIAQYRPVEKPFSVRPEQIPFRAIYGPSAEVHWVNFPTENPNVQGRCRVDLYPFSSLVILTDIMEVSVQHFIEDIFTLIYYRFGVDPGEMTVIQRYQHELDLINRVNFSFHPSTALVTNPVWEDVSQDSFERLIRFHESLARNCPPWLIPSVSWIYKALGEGIERLSAQRLPRTK